MSRYFARIVRALIVSLFGLGGGIGLMVFIVMLFTKGHQHAFQYGLKAGVSIGLVIAVLGVLVLLLLDVTAHLFLAKGKYREIWELEQTREMQYDGTLKELTALCRQALLVVPAVKSVSEDMEHLLLRASIGPSVRSPGEKVEVEINPEADNKWKVRCTSKSLQTNIVFDYGKNFENVESWLSKMTSLIAAQQKQSQG